MRVARNWLTDGQRNGEFRISDPNTSMLMLLGGLRAVLRFGDKPIASNLAEQIVDGFLHGALSSHPALQVSAN
jgi:hypothetical protein